MSLRFGTKAETLQSLYGVLHHAKVADLAYFSFDEWSQDPGRCLNTVLDELGSGPWIVRSSAQSEDQEHSSNAGAFLSILDVKEEGLEGSIRSVFESFSPPSGTDQVLVQPMIGGVVESGVAFSHDPTTCSPYRVVNWASGGDTAAVTAGKPGTRSWRCAAGGSRNVPARFSPLVDLLEELLELFGNSPVDLEYAVTLDQGERTLWLLQARPLVLGGEPESSEEQEGRLRLIHRKLLGAMRPHPFLVGKTTVFGVMPDWNPAEIVGTRPKPLALSLYRELITDSIWAYQRHNYGYRNLRSFPLMPHFFGLPYIDVRLSFNSFVPADLDEKLASRLVDYYLERLMHEPTLHDKVEFEVVFSCYTLDLDERIRRLEHEGFSSLEQEIVKDSLRRLTNRILHPEEGLWRKDAERLSVLGHRREELFRSDTQPVDRIYWLLEDAKRYGTLPFAGLARAGFVAIQMLRSLVGVGIFSPEDCDAFLSSVSTVSGQLTRDRHRLDRAGFLQRYGHLRPGTYDIMSPRYDEIPDRYFDWSMEAPEPEAPRAFSLTLHQMREIGAALKEHGLLSDPVGLFDFLQAGIELRESSKFEFTRNLSTILSLVEVVGSEWGYSREELAFADIGAFKELYVGAIDPKGVIGRSIEQGHALYEQTLRTLLPPLISSPDDVWSFEWPDAAPNFVTQKQVTAHVVSGDDAQALDGGIVCIPNADPGYDWIFARPIAGLITAWGGVNSHMAIRAGELGIPAIIGAGETLYRLWSSSRRLQLDCANRVVQVLE